MSLNSINRIHCNFFICCHPFQNQRVEVETCRDSPMIEIEPLNEIAIPSPLPTLRLVHFLSYIVSMAIWLVLSAIFSFKVKIKLCSVVFFFVCVCVSCHSPVWGEWYCQMKVVWVYLKPPHPSPFSWGCSEDVWVKMLSKDLKYQHNKSLTERHPSILPKMRAVLLDWLMEVCRHGSGEQCTTYHCHWPWAMEMIAKCQTSYQIFLRAPYHFDVRHDWSDIFDFLKWPCLNVPCSTPGFPSYVNVSGSIVTIMSTSLAFWVCYSHLKDTIEP